MERRQWLEKVRRPKKERFDHTYPSIYDEWWGRVPPTHQRFVSNMLDQVPERGTVLDAACGTGRLLPLVVACGRRVHCVDWSPGMLKVARQKFPDVRA